MEQASYLNNGEAIPMGGVRIAYPNWSEHNAKLRRGKSKEAISLALQGRWDMASQVNLGILQLFPDDVEALNRLGKAHIEMGRYTYAREAFEEASRLAPYNTITKKNLERLEHLQESTVPPKQGNVVTPYLCIEESGKSVITVLQKPLSPEILAKMAAGDGVNLRAQDNFLVVESNDGEYLGIVEPKLGMRLMRLEKDGNVYNAAIVSINRQDISIIIWEAYRHPDLANVCSFPTRSKEDQKAYWRGARLRYDIDSEADEDDEFGPELEGRYHIGSGIPDGEDPIEAHSSGRLPPTMSYEE